VSLPSVFTRHAQHFTSNKGGLVPGAGRGGPSQRLGVTARPVPDSTIRYMANGLLHMSFTPAGSLEPPYTSSMRGHDAQQMHDHDTLPSPNTVTRLQSSLHLSD